MWYNGDMDGQEYLNQISAKSAPVKLKSKTNGILSSKITWFLVGAVGVFILLAIIGLILNAGKGDLVNDITRLQLHLQSTSEVISEYQPKVKSSLLRSHSASLDTVLTNTSSELTNYIKDSHEKNKEAEKNIAEQIKTEQDALLNELFEAKITGILDRIYAHKMAYEITMLMNEEMKVYNESRNDALKDIMDESYNSLKKLYDNFNNFSEGS